MFAQLCSGSYSHENGFFVPCSRASLSEKFTRAEMEGEQHHVSEISPGILYGSVKARKHECHNKGFGGLSSGSVSSVTLSDSVHTFRGVDGWSDLFFKISVLFL